MVRRDAALLRKQRLQEIERRMAQGISRGIDLDKLLDWIEYEIGLTRKTAMRYVELIVRKQGWVRDGRTIRFE